MTPDQTSDPAVIRNSWDDPEFTEPRVRDAIVRLETRGDQWKDAALDAESERDELRAEVERFERMFRNAAHAAKKYTPRAKAAEAEVERLRATVARVEALADEWNGEAEWTESTFLPGPNSDSAARCYRECADDLRAVLAGGVAADAPTSSDGGAK